MRELIGAEVLVISQDKEMARRYTRLLSSAKLQVHTVAAFERAYTVLNGRFFPVILVDLDTVQATPEVDVVTQLKQCSPTSGIIALTASRSYEQVIGSIRAGAIDVVQKDPDRETYLRDRVLEAAGRSVGSREVSSILGEARDVHEDFLQRFVEAERRALDLADRLAGRNVDPVSGDIRVLVVDKTDRVAKELIAFSPPGFQFENALSGGQALDWSGTEKFHIVMVSRGLQDLPSSMVVRSIKTQNPGLITIEYSGPTPPGMVEMVESNRRVSLVKQFIEVSQLAQCLDYLSKAYRQKAREMRYTRAFRERHADFIRRFVELKLKIDRMLS